MSDHTGFGDNWKDFVEGLEPHDQILAELYQRLNRRNPRKSSADWLELNLWLIENKRDILANIADHLNIRQETQ